MDLAMQENILNVKKYLKKHGWTSRKRTDIWRFAEQMKEGDLVVLVHYTANRKLTETYIK